MEKKLLEIEEATEVGIRLNINEIVELYVKKEQLQTVHLCIKLNGCDTLVSYYRR